MNPNIILISVDSLRHDFRELARRNGIPLPNFDRLAKLSTYFSYAVTQGTSSIASHASALTGLAPWQIGTGVHLHLPAPHRSIFSLLDNYFTISWHRGVVYLEDRPEEKEAWNNQAGHNVCADEKIDEITAFIKNPPKQPYCMFLHFRYVHWPYGDSEGWSWGDERYEEAKALLLGYQHSGNFKAVEQLYAECVSRMDQKLGKILDVLPDNTIFVLFGDHGDHFGVRVKDRTTISIYDAHIACPYDEVLRVPLFIKAPIAIASKTVPVPLTALVPTIFSLLDRPIPEDRLSPPLTSDKTCPIIESWGDVHLGGPTDLANGHAFRVVRKLPWKLIVDLYTKKIELYNIVRGASETRDVKDENPKIVANLLAAIHGAEWGHTLYEQPIARLKMILDNLQELRAIYA